MITTDLLNANEVLNTLSEEQKTAVCELSKADEGIVIGERIGKVYGDLDADILATSGIEKDGTEKTYAYAKRVIANLKGEAEKVDALKKENAKLQKALESGAADTETKKALAQAKADLADITKKYTELNTATEQMKEEHARELFGLKMQGELDAATKGIKFKSSLPESVTNVVLSNVIDKIKGSADYVQSEGREVLVFKGENGEILRDSTLKPLTAKDLILRELDTMDVIDHRREQRGAGSSGQQTTEGKSVIDLSGVRTQNEAEQSIHSTLIARGLTRGSREYEEEMQAAWKANAVNKLPRM